MIEAELLLHELREIGARVHVLHLSMPTRALPVCRLPNSDTMVDGSRRTSGSLLSAAGVYPRVIRQLLQQSFSGDGQAP